MMDAAENDAAEQTSKQSEPLNTPSLSILDRSVSILIPHPDYTASWVKDKIPPSIERTHRWHGTSVIWQASKLVGISASTYATACVIFHRFLHQRSLAEYDVWGVAMASVLLAVKTEEEEQDQALSIKTWISTFAHIYRRRLLIILEDQELDDGGNRLDPNKDVQTLQRVVIDHPLNASIPAASALSASQKVSIITENTPSIPSKTGPVFQEWHKIISKMEQVLLRQLGFSLYWIPDAHPHKFILYFVKGLSIDDSKVAERAWSYCNDACRTDLCVRFQPEIIACTAIYLAALDHSVNLPTMPRPWWEVFVGHDKEKDLSMIANAILATSSQDDLIAVVCHGFVKSLVPGGSFNDPGSFLWDHQCEISGQQ